MIRTPWLSYAGRLEASNEFGIDGGWRSLRVLVFEQSNRLKLKMAISTISSSSFSGRFEKQYQINFQFMNVDPIITDLSLRSKNKTITNLNSTVTGYLTYKTIHNPQKVSSQSHSTSDQEPRTQNLVWRGCLRNAHPLSRWCSLLRCSTGRRCTDDHRSRCLTHKP